MCLGLKALAVSEAVYLEKAWTRRYIFRVSVTSAGSRTRRSSAASAGLVPRVRRIGGSTHHGGITREG